MIFLMNLYLDHSSSFNYINDFKPVLSADDTSLIITNSSPIDFKKDITTVFVQLNKWFNANSLLLNYEKTYYIYVITKSSSFIDTFITIIKLLQVPLIQNSLEHLLKIHYLGKPI